MQRERLRQQLALRKALSGTRKRKPPKAVKPLAIVRAYERDLLELVRDWQKELLEIVRAGYPRLLAESKVRAAIDSLSTLGAPRLDARADLLEEFNRAFERARQRVNWASRAPRIATRMTESISMFNRQQLDRQFRAVTGFGFPDVRSNAGALLEQARRENVRLIEGMARNERARLEDLLANASRRGDTIATLAERIQGDFGRTETQAASIARNQTFAINAELNQVRMQEVGVDKYTWSTSLDEKVREDHQALEGREFSFDDPPVADDKSGERYNPGERFNCLLPGTRVDLLDLPRKFFRRYYAGETTVLVTQSGANICTTPNHPTLTQRGWVPAHLIDEGDYLLRVLPDVTGDPNNGDTLCDELFSFVSVLFQAQERRSNPLDFHGDGSDQEIDVVSFESLLGGEGDLSFGEFESEFFFTPPDFPRKALLASLCAKFQTILASRFTAEGDVGVFGHGAEFFAPEFPDASEHCFTTVAWVDAVLAEYADHCATREGETFGDCLYAYFSREESQDLLLWKIQSFVMWCMRKPVDRRLETPDAETLTQNVRTHFEGSSGVCQIGSRTYSFDRVAQKSIGKFAGFVYNFETPHGWYHANDLAEKNCRCSALPVFDFL